MEIYRRTIEGRLSTSKYEHSLGVAKTAQELASRNGIDSDQAYLAGLIHDYAKEIGNQELLKIGKNNNLILDPAELQNPRLLHGPVGAVLIQHELGINDQEILNAVRYHTTGCAEMAKLTQIIYIADYIEPNRQFDGVEKLREITYHDLAEGVLEGLNHTIKSIVANNQFLHLFSVQARNWILGEK